MILRDRARIDDALAALQAAHEAYACEAMEANSGHFDEADSWNRLGQAKYQWFLRWCEDDRAMKQYCFDVLARYERLKAAKRLVEGDTDTILVVVHHDE